MDMMFGSGHARSKAIKSGRERERESLRARARERGREREMLFGLGHVRRKALTPETECVRESVCKRVRVRQRMKGRAGKREKCCLAWGLSEERHSNPIRREREREREHGLESESEREGAGGTERERQVVWLGACQKEGPQTQESVCVCAQGCERERVSEREGESERDMLFGLEHIRGKALKRVYLCTQRHQELLRA